MENSGSLSFIMGQLSQFFQYTAFANLTLGNIAMILIGVFFIYLAIVREYEPMLLVPIGFGILIGNVAFHPGLQLGVFESGSVLNYLYLGVLHGIYPSLIFLGIGAMSDFSAIISNPKLILIGIVTQLGIFSAYVIAIQLGFTPSEAGAIGIIGGADGPTAIFLSSKLAPDLIAAIAISAYAYMALIPIIQPIFMKLLTTSKERVIRMKPLRMVSQREKILFPIAGLLLTCLLVPAALPLLGMLFFGNLLKESNVTKRLAEVAKGAIIDTVTILVGLTIGASAQAATFLTMKTLSIFGLGIVSIIIATIGGVLFVKIMNIFL
jgi:oxaloacetate decarboxylase beta subunit